MNFGAQRQSSSSQSSFRPVDVQASEFKGLRGGFSDVLRGLMGQGGQDPSETFAGIPSFFQEGDPRSAEITENELALLERLMGEGDTRRGLLEQTLAGGFLPGTEGGNPFLEAAIIAAQRPTLQGLEETLSRTLPGRFTQAGQFVQPQGSSAFDRAAAIASRGAADALSDIATQMSFGVHEAERGRQQEAIGLSQREVETTIQNLQAQALPRLIEELGIERGMAEFQTRIQALLGVLQTLAGVTAPAIGQQGQSSSRGSGSTFSFGLPNLGN